MFDADRSLREAINAANLASGSDTFTNLLQTGSPANDGGDNNSCPATDQSGESRPEVGEGDDISTCEFGAMVMPTVAKKYIFLPIVIK